MDSALCKPRLARSHDYTVIYYFCLLFTKRSLVDLEKRGGGMSGTWPASLFWIILNVDIDSAKLFVTEVPTNF